MKIQRWLTAVTILHGTLLFLLVIGLMVRVSTVATKVRDSLLRSNIAVEQVDRMNEAFSSIQSDLLWVLLISLVLTAVSFSLLRSIISKNWHQTTSNQQASSELPSERSTTLKEQD
jgi:hypothetical protein